MPVQHGYTTREGRKVGFYKWGDSGHMYVYQIGDEEERKRAKRMAERQGRAAHASGYGG